MKNQKDKNFIRDLSKIVSEIKKYKKSAESYGGAIIILSMCLYQYIYVVEECNLLYNLN